MKKQKYLRITLKKSLIGKNWRHRRTAQALGLRKRQQTVVKPDNPAIRGMIEQIKYMLEVEEVEDAAS